MACNIRRRTYVEEAATTANILATGHFLYLLYFHKTQKVNIMQVVQRRLRYINFDSAVIEY
jgi:hypothetical protein